LRVYFKSLSSMKAVQVWRADIRSVLNEIAKTAPIQANRALAVVRKMFNWAVEQDIIEISPCTHIPRPGEENQRDRTLSEEEIKRVLKGLNGDGTALASCMKLRLITAQRGGAVISMEWSIWI
jgi:site-specific recombinase XerD